MKKITIYILTNEAMPDYIKIGKTDKDPFDRAKELFKTGVPLPFEVFYAKEISNEDVESVEKKIHEIFGDYRENPKREFFTVDPEKARTLLELIPGEEVDTDKEYIEDIKDKEIIEKKKKQRSNFNFSMVNIPIGAELFFTKGNNETVTVKSENNRVELDGEDISISAAALKLLHKNGFTWKTAQGSSLFLYNNELLEDRRKRIENSRYTVD